MNSVQGTASSAPFAGTNPPEATNKVDNVSSEMKSVIHYAEDTVHGDDAKLSELGWGGRAESHALQAPGQPRLLEAPEQSAGRLTLDWKKPLAGGTPASYKVERRELIQGGTWALAEIAINTEITLNKAGEGEPSNIVTAML
ncbi:MAG: fibronectin type III domain-containing protein [Candidatus Electrothrix sp. GW3-4]|uniref:fibronectin type III domain-containing protein n=1 Tax=Candidatus Electrothrix sp. GW3-4 TaxID=3126740 RepID=UPI0030D0E696